MTLPPVPLTDPPMRRAKKKTRRRLLSQLLRSARLKLRPRLPQRRPRPSLRGMKLPRGISSLVAFRTTSTRNGSLASSRISGSYLGFESSPIGTLAVPKGEYLLMSCSSSRLTSLQIRVRRVCQRRRRCQSPEGYARVRDRRSYHQCGLLQAQSSSLSASRPLEILRR